MSRRRFGRRKIQPIHLPAD